VLEIYLKEALDSFVKDPADSDYQRGYLACLLEMYEIVAEHPNRIQLQQQLGM